MTRPIVVAHAGGSAHAPANTFGAYRHAHATWPGVWMEFDAQFSADGELMAIHDDTLDRTTDRSGFVADHTAEQLQSCNAAASHADWPFEPVPRVRDLLAEGREAGWRLICEVKNIPGQHEFDPSGQRYATALTEILSDTGFPVDRLVVICFWSPTLDAVKALDASIALGFLSVPDLPGDLGLSAQDTVALCAERGYHVAAPRHTTPDLSPELVSAARERGVQMHVWTANEPDDIARAVSLGLDGITSDHPDRVLAALDG